MKIGDYSFVAYKIKTPQSAIKQIDRVWEKNKELLTARWLDKVSQQGRMPLNKTVEGLYHDFKRKVLENMSVVFGGKNKMEGDVNVNLAIERALRSSLFQSKEQLFKINMLSRLQDSPSFTKIQKIDPSITISDVISKGQYIKKLSSDTPGLENIDMDSEFDEAYDKVVLYVSPHGYRFLIYTATSASQQKIVQI